MKLFILIYAAIDIGSNAVRLLIKESIIDSNNNNYHFKKISYTRLPIRLGNDVFTSGEISHDNIVNLTKAFKAFRLLMEINKVDFNFNRCENNINLFKKELRNDEIVYIEKKLKKYLYPF